MWPLRGTLDAHVQSTLETDVAIVGAGIAGLSAAVLLRRAGLDVACIDAVRPLQRRVGESLDWSSPGLLGRMGVTADSLIAGDVATFKKHIVVCERGRPQWLAAPPSLIRRRPLRFETVTLHVDRAGLDRRLFEEAAALGTTFVWERVADVAIREGRILGCTTASGRALNARWFLDASGTARVLSRRLEIPATFYGRRKVCLWTYFKTPPLREATSFFVDNGDDYLSWVWDIPISGSETSVGYVLPADLMAARRRGGESVQAILHAELARHERFRPLLETQTVAAVESTSFQPYVTATVCGPNWLMIGEAASMPDPLTGNGVTSGIRHARHAVEAILGCPSGAMSPSRQRRYSQHVFRLGHAFNAHIERAIYRRDLRQGLGLKTATYVYTMFAFFMNALHARFDPRGTAGMATFGLLFAGARIWIGAWTMAGRAALRWKRTATPGAA
jgi:flavin-dependent dehydrogenase